jgi:phospholipase C
MIQRIAITPGLLLLASQALAVPAFKHVVIVFQENRTPDNVFGSNPTFEPGVDLATSGVNSKGQTIPLTAIPLDDCYDIGHSHAQFEVSLQGADLDTIYPKEAARACVPPANPQFKFVDNSTGAVQPYFDIATNYGFANRMFQTNQGPSFPAHQFIFGGTSAPTPDTPLFAAENLTSPVLGVYAGCIAPFFVSVYRIDGYGSEASQPPTYPCYEHRTLADLLDAAKPAIGWRYYAPSPGYIWTAPDAIRHICRPNLEHTACTGRAWTNGDVVPDNPAQVLTDIAKCQLKGVVWVIPNNADSDHPGGNKGLGPQWVASIVNAVGNQPACAGGETYWDDTAVIITWDDWGGWYDHVKPFAINVRPNSPPAWGDGYTYGFRVPLMVVSAYTQAGTVSNEIRDFGSILYFVEKNFGLGFIGPGTSTYTRYADYQAQSRGALAEFFTLNTARGFVPIPTRVPAKYFIDARGSSGGPDDE